MIVERIFSYGSYNTKTHWANEDMSAPEGGTVSDNFHVPTNDNVVTKDNFDRIVPCIIDCKKCVKKLRKTIFSQP